MAKPGRQNEVSNQQSEQTISQTNDSDLRRIRREIEKSAAETEEEVDALRVNLHQDDDLESTQDGTGRVVDDLAEEKIAQFTEVGPLAGERGAISLTPGRDDPSRTLRHQPNTDLARAEESDLDEPRDESAMDRKVDEGTAA